MEGSKPQPVSSRAHPGSRRSQLPVDHGWAWLVMLGALLNVSCVMIFLRSTSLLFIHFLDKYEESAIMTTLAFGLCSAMFALSNIFGPTFLLHRFEVRTLGIVGASVNCMCIFIIAFAPNMLLIDFMMAFMGLSHGLIFVPQMTLIGRYFKKRLALATSVVNLGLSIGTIAGPPLTQMLIDTYGLRGSIIVLSGINMHCIPAALLLRPVSHYFSTILDRDGDNIEISEVTDEFDAAKRTLLKNSEIPPSKLERNTSGNDRDFKEDLDINSPKILPPLNGLELEETKLDALKARKTSADVNAVLLYSTEDHMNYLQQYMGVTLGQNDSTEDENLEMNLASKEQVYFQNEYPKVHLETDSWATSVSMIASVAYMTSMGSLSRQNLEQNSSQRHSVFRRIKHSASRSIYSSPLAILLLLGLGLGVHTQTCIGYMPAAGRENGLNDDQVPYLVTIIGICDLISKLAIGVFADTGYVKRIHIACVSEIVIGTLVQFVGYFQGFGLMIVLQVGVGCSIGVLHALAAVIIVDTLGLQHMGHIMAGYFLVNGLVMSTDHLITGSIKDFTGSFLLAYNYIGGLILLSAFLLLLESVFTRVKPLTHSKE